MSEYFNTVKSYLLDLDLAIDEEDTPEELVVVSDEDRGVNHLIVDCEDPILIIEQGYYAHSQCPWRSVQKVARNESHARPRGVCSR